MMRRSREPVIEREVQTQMVMSNLSVNISTPSHVIVSIIHLNLHALKFQISWQMLGVVNTARDAELFTFSGLAVHVGVICVDTAAAIAAAAV